MVVDFLVDGYTELRYLLPVAERVGCHHTKRAFVNRRTRKYNTVATLGIEMMEVMLRERGITLHESEHPVGGDVIFSVGVIPHAEMRGSYARVVALQHAFDYTTSKSHSDKNTMAVFWDAASQEQFRLLEPSCASFVPRVPVTFWNAQSDLNFLKMQSFQENAALVFYPDVGYHAEVGEICAAIKGAGLIPIVKQRAKHQPILSIAGTHEVYDRIWYPSESIFLALGSRFCVGLGTGAYADTCAAGIDFIDFPLPSYSRQYAKPTCDQFHVGDPQNLSGQIDAVLERSRSRRISQLTEEDVRDFFVSAAGEDLR